MRSQGERKAPESWKGILHFVTAFPSDVPCIVKITCLWNRKESCLPSPLGFCLFVFAFVFVFSTQKESSQLSADFI